MPNLGDVSAVDWSPYRGSVAVVVGGSPCQAFSVAGLRKSLEDPRGNLTLEYVRAVHAIRPRYAVWENVPGVLSTSDNAFGCFLAALVGADEALAPEESWPGAGMVCGPGGRAAWRLLDAQWFGLAQRRLRVFVVFCPGGGADPGEVLFERPRLLGNSPSRGEAGEGVAGTIAARTRAGGGLGTDFDCSGGLQAVPDVSFALNAKGGGGRIDGESETFVAHSLRADGFDASEDGTGRGTPLVPVANTLKANNGGGGFGSDPNETFIPVANSLNENSGRMQIEATYVPFHGTQDPCANYGDTAPTIGCNQGQEACIAYGIGSHASAADGDQTNRSHAGGGPVRAASGGSSRTYVGVRRLTPTECERLQGFHDGHTDIPYRGKPAADGPRYRALGNSMAVPVMRWIGRRIIEAHRAIEGAA